MIGALETSQSWVLRYDIAAFFSHAIHVQDALQPTRTLLTIESPAEVTILRILGPTSRMVHCIVCYLNVPTIDEALVQLLVVTDSLHATLLAFFHDYIEQICLIVLLRLCLNSHVS